MWEYKTINVKATDDMLAVLNELGEEGWEVILHMGRFKFGFQDYRIELLLKRPKKK